MRKILINQGYFGIILFITLNVIAMIFYPGGTIIDSTTEGYLFFYNFFSNLGEWTARNGQSNQFSAYLFNSSMIILALSYSLFYIAFLRMQVRVSDNSILNFLLIITLIISLIGFVCVAIFSSDPETFDIHLLFVKIGFYSLFSHCIVQYVFIKSIDSFGKLISTITLVFVILLFVFILIMEFGPSPFENNQSLFIHVTSQKIIVSSILIYFFFQIKEARSLI